MLTGILEPTHLLLILGLALLFLGPKRLPSAGRALGQGLREFRGSISGDAQPAELASDETGAQPESTPH
jgi:sec-independent protein translocase protein TatA